MRWSLYAATSQKLINTEYDVLLIEQDSFFGGVLNNSRKIKNNDDQETAEWLKNTENLINKSSLVFFKKLMEQNLKNPDLN